MSDNCHRHLFERAEGGCRECGLACCGDCLVYTGGAAAPPMCITCALARSGIRGSRRTRPSRRARRAMAKVEKVHQKAQTEDQGVEVAAMPAAVAGDGERSWETLDASQWDLRTL